MKPDRTTSTGIYLFGPFKVDPAANRLERDGTILLTGKPVDTLIVLLSHRDRTVEKDELMRAVWPDAFVSEDSLTHCISALRKALGDDSSQPQFIVTIPRRGYRFIGSVTEPMAPEPVVTPSEIADAPAASGNTAARVRWRPSLLLSGAAAALVAAAVVVALGALPGDPPAAAPMPAIRFAQDAPVETTLTSGAVLSPDGRYLAFVARHAEDGQSRLWLRALDSTDARPLQGTEGAFRPFWAPDSQAIGFFANGWLKRVGVGGSPPQTLATVGYRPSGGTWSADGTILYADRMSPIYAVPDSGSGPSVAVTTLDASRGEVAHYAPEFLPDGRYFLYYVDSRDEQTSGTYVGSVDSGAATRLLDGASTPVAFAAPRHLIFIRDRVVMAQPFDPRTRRLSGTAVPLGTGIASSSDTLSAAAGLLAFGGSATAEHLVWFDRTGRELGELGAGTLHNPVLSPDQTQLVADNRGVWLVDLERSAPTRVADGTLPQWSADGLGVVFTARRVAGSADVLLRPLAGRADDEQVLIRSNEMMLSGDWSRDGRHFVYVASNPKTRLDVWVLTKDGSGQPHPFLQSPVNEMHPRISPDGSWIAYASDESGTWEVYVQAFPHGGSKRVVSVGGGVDPQWTKAGRELTYLTPDGGIMAVDISADDVLDAGRPHLLFRFPMNGDVTRYRNYYAVTADGDRFIVDTVDESSREPISVVVNWQALLRD